MIDQIQTQQQHLSIANQISGSHTLFIYCKSLEFTIMHKMTNLSNKLVICLVTIMVLPQIYNFISIYGLQLLIFQILRILFNLSRELSKLPTLFDNEVRNIDCISLALFLQWHSFIIDLSFIEKVICSENQLIIKNGYIELLSWTQIGFNQLQIFIIVSLL